MPGSMHGKNVIQAFGPQAITEQPGPWRRAHFLPDPGGPIVAATEYDNEKGWSTEPHGVWSSLETVDS